MQITGLICFLFAFFCIVVVPFFFLLLSCFFVFLCICLGFCNFFPKSCLSSWSLVWFAFFSLSFCFLPRFFNFFRNHVCPVGPWSDLLFFLHVFAFLFFAPFRVAFFNCVFFFFFCICSFCFSRVCTPHLHVFCFISIFFQVENLLEQAQFDNTMFTVFPLQKKRDTNHQAAARTQPRVAESLSLFPPTKSHQM